MIDIGVVYYRIKSTGNAIDATWYTSRLDKKETGSGIAKGDTSNGFPGSYIVTFCNPDGSDSGTFDLKIEKSGPIYDLSYREDGADLVTGRRYVENGSIFNNHFFISQEKKRPE